MEIALEIMAIYFYSITLLNAGEYHIVTNGNDINNESVF